jgi:hypothetical protein
MTGASPNKANVKFRISSGRNTPHLSKPKGSLSLFFLASNSPSLPLQLVHHLNSTLDHRSRQSPHHDYLPGQCCFGLSLAVKATEAFHPTFQSQVC